MSKNFIQRWLLPRKFPTGFGRACADTKGVAAVEFGLLIFPFLLLLFAIMESGLQLFITSALDTAVRKESRALQIGRAQAQQMSADDFKQAICKQLPMPGACNNLKIDVRAIDGWAAVTTRFRYSTESDRRLNAISEPTEFCLPTDNRVILVRAFLEIPVISGFWLVSGPDPASEIRGVTANHLFRVEPFGAASTEACLW